MKSSYNKLADYISELDVRNKDGKIDNLIGVSITKEFIPSVANIIGTDLTNYKVIDKNVFACSLMQVSRDGGIAVALYNKDYPSIMSPAYHLFKVKNSSLLSDYLFLILKSSEFDRAAVFYAVGGVRGTLTWEEFTNMRIPVPSIEVQKNIIKQYKTIENRIFILERKKNILVNLIDTLYNNYFVVNKNDNWPIMSLSEIMSYSGGQQPPAKKFIYEEKEGYVRLIQIRDYENDNYKTYIPKSNSNKLCYEDDIMIARYGVSLGRICYGLNGAYNVALAKVFPKKDFYREYLRCLLNSTDFYNLLCGVSERSAQQGFNSNGIDAYKINMPPEDLLKKFDEIGRKIFYYRLNIDKQIKLLEKLKEHLLLKIL